MGSADLQVAGALDDVEVGDDVPVRVPYKARARTLRNLHHVQRERIPPALTVEEPCKPKENLPMWV